MLRILVELISGAQPYAECRGISDLLRKIQKGVKPLVYKRISHAGARELIDACLQFDPSKRPSASVPPALHCPAGHSSPLAEVLPDGQ